MSIRIRVGLSRKVGEPHYSSRGASIELEAEIDNQVVADSQQFHQQVQVLYGLARRSLDAELDRSAQTAGLIGSNGHQNGGQGSIDHQTNGQSSNGQGPNSHQTSGGQPGDLPHGNHQTIDRFAAGPTGGSSVSGSHNDHGPVSDASQRSGVPTATQSQLRAIYALTKRQQLDPVQCAQQQFGKPRIEHLNIREASQLIDQLKNRLSPAEA
jgi:hypothetical protein